MKKIAKEMLISELIDQVENKDAVVDKLMECGMHCLGCMMAHGETIEEAAYIFFWKKSTAPFKASAKKTPIRSVLNADRTVFRTPTAPAKFTATARHAAASTMYFTIFLLIPLFCRPFA